MTLRHVIDFLFFSNWHLQNGPSGADNVLSVSVKLTFLTIGFHRFSGVCSSQCCQSPLRNIVEIRERKAEWGISDFEVKLEPRMFSCSAQSNCHSVWENIERFAGFELTAKLMLLRCFSLGLRVESKRWNKTCERK